MEPKRIIAMGLACVVLAACGGQQQPHRAAAIQLGPPQYRALWVDAFHPGFKSPREIDQLVADAHHGNLNALFVQVRPDANCYCRDSLEPVATDITGPRGFDPLAYLLRKAHAQTPRIEVHAWVNTFYVNEHSAVYQAHAADWANRSSDGQTGGFLDPGSPSARDYTTHALLHLAQHYDIDGLHLDFIRYPEGGNWGYSPTALAAFDTELERTGSPDPYDPLWAQWRRDQVTIFVRDLSFDLNHLKPHVKLSAAVIPWGDGPATANDWAQSSAYSEVFQDWDGWLREGIIDLAVPMNYDVAYYARYEGYYRQWLTWEKDHQYHRGILVGIGAYMNYPEGTLQQIREALAPSAKGNVLPGVALYSYASTSPYATTDYYQDPTAAADLPRQPYDGGLDAAGLARRAGRFNTVFWNLLSAPGAYLDPSLGVVQTDPVFATPAPVPPLPWKR